MRMRMMVKTSYLLRTTMMMVLEMTVMQARMGMMMPRRG